MTAHNFTYASVLADSLKVNWRVEDLISEARSLDFSRPFLPEALAQVGALACLDAREKLLLNQIRGKGYLGLFAFAEEFILPFILDQARHTVHEDLHELRALLTFADEEAKHIHLFKRFSEEFEKGFGTRCDAVGPAAEFAEKILRHSAFGVVLAILHLEWMSQEHYLDSVKGDDAAALDPRFAGLLRHHWMEEAQHAKIDTLLAYKIAGGLTPGEIEAGLRDYFSIGGILDEVLNAQVRMDVESLARAAGRALSAEEAAEITAAQLKAYRWTFLGSGMTHPAFVKVLGDLTVDGQARVAEMVKALS